MPFPSAAATPKTSRHVTAWPLGREHSSCAALHSAQALTEVLTQTASSREWKWPRRPIFFITDPHADTEAFVASLLASGGVRLRGSEPQEFELTATGKEAEFIIGGDCLDKGPSDLKLLRALRRLIDTGAQVTLLAGNHDVRLLMGLRAMGVSGDPTTEHFFVRMGPKVVPLLKEVHDSLLGEGPLPETLPDEEECRRRLYPSPHWFEAFPRAVRGRIPAAMLERELTRMRHKVRTFGEVCAAAGLTMRQVFAAATRCQQLFLSNDGEFAWFFRDMQLMRRHGSFLFVHAGIDDGIVTLIERCGVDEVNRRFHRLIESDLFGLYFGTLGNCIRTKYRAVDLPLTHRGAAGARRLGLPIIVHGHGNRTGGQRLVLRQGILHIESDVTLDRNSRYQEGLSGAGAGVTVIDPSGYVDGISADFPEIKRFEPARFLREAQ